jgi:hypothetical protein
MDVTLNERSKESIKRTTGLDVDSISSMDAEDVDGLIEKKIGKKLAFQYRYGDRFVPRGSVYLFLKRLFPIDLVNKIISRI